MWNIRNRKGVNLMAFHGKLMVGGVSISLKPGIRRHDGSYGIVIAKDFRGIGLGKLLTKLVLQEAKKNLSGLKIVTLDVFKANKPAIKLYTKMGFKKYGELPKGVIYRGKPTDCVFMYKNIR